MPSLIPGFQPAGPFYQPSAPGLGNGSLPQVPAAPEAGTPDWIKHFDEREKYRRECYKDYADCKDRWGRAVLDGDKEAEDFLQTESKFATECASKSLATLR